MARRRERAQHDRRLEKLAIEVLTATGEREAIIAATEQRAGAALQAMSVKRIDLEEVELMLLKPCPNGLWSWTRRRTTSAEQCRSLDLSSMSWRSRSNGRGLMISCLLTQQGECSTTQTFVATSGIQQPGRLACMASHLTIFAIQQLPWRSVRERTSRLCSDCSGCVSVDDLGRLQRTL